MDTSPILEFLLLPYIGMECRVCKCIFEDVEIFKSKNPVRYPSKSIEEFELCCEDCYPETTKETSQTMDKQRMRRPIETIGPMPHEALTTIEGDHTRHIEQLWDEIKKLREDLKRRNEKEDAEPQGEFQEFVNEITKAQFEIDSCRYSYSAMKIRKELEWCDKIPYIQFPNYWHVQIIPPFFNAIIRFRVIANERQSKDFISVYLDDGQTLGCWAGPYWEAFPIDGKAVRFSMENIDGLIEAINGELGF